VAAASAVAANVLPLPVPPDNGGPDGGPIVMVCIIALLAPLIALILVVLVGKAAFCREMAKGLIGNMGMKVNQSLTTAEIFRPHERPLPCHCEERSDEAIPIPSGAKSRPDAMSVQDATPRVMAGAGGPPTICLRTTSKAADAGLNVATRPESRAHWG
jgi:hypothetical protein